MEVQFIQRAFLSNNSYIRTIWSPIPRSPQMLKGDRRTTFSNWTLFKLPQKLNPKRSHFSWNPHNHNLEKTTTKQIIALKFQWLGKFNYLLGIYGDTVEATTPSNKFVRIFIAAVIFRTNLPAYLNCLPVKPPLSRLQKPLRLHKSKNNPLEIKPSLERAIKKFSEMCHVIPKKVYEKKCRYIFSNPLSSRQLNSTLRNFSTRGNSPTSWFSCFWIDNGKSHRIYVRFRYLECFFFLRYAHVIQKIARVK